MHGIRFVYFLSPAVVESIVDFVFDLIVDDLKNCKPIGLRQRLKSCGYVYTVSEKIIFFFNHISRIHPNTKFQLHHNVLRRNPF